MASTTTAGAPAAAEPANAAAAADRKAPFLLDARVLDAEWLDSYLAELLLLPALQEAETSSSTATTASSPSSFPSQFQWRLWLRRYKDDLVVLLQLATLLATGTTPAARLLRLEWKNYAHNSSSSENNTSGLRALQPNLVAYAVLRLTSRVYQHYRRHVHSMLILSRQHDFIRSRSTLPPPPQQQQQQSSLALERQARMCHVIDRLVAWLRVIVWFGSWAGGGAATSWCRTPNLAMLCSGNYLQPIRRKTTHHLADDYADTKKLHVDYAYRRWLWMESMGALRILFAGLPLLRQVWKPVVDHLIQYTRSSLANCLFKLKSSSGIIPESSSSCSCPLCGLEPIRIPFRTNCGHTYCYTCLYKYTTKPSSTSASHATAMPCRTCRAPITHAIPAPLP